MTLDERRREAGRLARITGWSLADWQVALAILDDRPELVRLVVDMLPVSSSDPVGLARSLRGAMVAPVGEPLARAGVLVSRDDLRRLVGGTLAGDALLLRLAVIDLLEHAREALRLDEALAWVSRRLGARKALRTRNRHGPR